MKCIKWISILILIFISSTARGETSLKQAPLNTIIPYPLQFQINSSGIKFLANQIKYGLESKGLKKKIVDALEGLTFQTYMPVIGGKLTFIILGAGDDSYDGVRYNKTEFKLFTTPPRILEKRATIDELYPVLTVTADANGVHPEIDLKIEHKFFTINKVTIQADIEVAGTFRIFTDNNKLSIKSSNFKSRLLYLYVPYVQLPQIPGMPGNLMHKVEKAFNDYLTDAIKQFFEKDINKALASAIEDALNKLIFDKNGDGIPDTLLDLQELFIKGNSLLGTHIENNLRFSVEVFTEPSEILVDVTGNLYSDSVSDTVAFPQNWFYRTIFEQDNCYGEDPPILPSYMPGTTEPYMGGISISDDLINQLLALLYNEGLFHFSINTATITNIDEKYKEYTTTKVFKLLNLEKFYDYFPNAPLQIDMTFREAPYILWENNHQARLFLPNLKVDISAVSNQGIFRLFSVAGDVSFGIRIEKVNLTAAPFLIFSLSPQTSVKVIYNEIAPEYNQAIENSFFPLTIGAISSAIPDYMKNFSLPITSCIEGLKIKNFVVTTYGKNSDNIYNYLQFLFNLGGRMDIDKFLSDCLNIQNFAPVVGNSPKSLPKSHYYRINGSPWLYSRTGEWWKALPAGSYRIDTITDGKIISFTYSKNKHKQLNIPTTKAGTFTQSEGCSQSGIPPLELLFIFIFLKGFVKIRGLTKH